MKIKKKYITYLTENGVVKEETLTLDPWMQFLIHGAFPIITEVSEETNED